MGNRSVYLLIAVAVLALLAFLYWRKMSGPDKFDWRDSWVKDAYSETSDQPYGTHILHRLVDGYFPGRRLINISKDLAAELPLDSLKRNSYLFVGEALFLDSLGTERLLDFVGLGNTAFLSSKTIPFDLMFHLYFEECENAGWNDYETHEGRELRVSLPALPLEKPVALHYAQQNRVVSYSWSYIESSYFCPELPQRALGYLDDSKVNFAEFPYGKGRFLLHTTPIAFSNYHLLRAGPREYVEGLLSFLPEGDIYWDSYSRVPEAVARRRNEERNLPSEHPLTYILKQAPLAWAWYLLLGLAGVYVFFRAKRRQRVIPIWPKNENSSYEFISTIANLHFREKNYQNLCVQNMRLFLAQVRERYGLVAQLDPQTLLPRIDAAFLERLAQVSEVPQNQIQDIFTQYTAAVRFEPTEDMMIRLHLAMEAFFKKAK